MPWNRYTGWVFWSKNSFTTISSWIFDQNWILSECKKCTVDWWEKTKPKVLPKIIFQKSCRNRIFSILDSTTTFYFGRKESRRVTRRGWEGTAQEGEKKKGTLSEMREIPLVWVETAVNGPWTVPAAFFHKVSLWQCSVKKFAVLGVFVCFCTSSAADFKTAF